MAGKSNISKILMEQVPGLGAGALGAKFVNNKLVPMIEESLPESMAPLADLAPAIIGVILMSRTKGKPGFVDYAAMGMVANSVGDVAEGYLPGITGVDEILADDVDRILADDTEYEIDDEGNIVYYADEE